MSKTVERNGEAIRLVFSEAIYEAMDSSGGGAVVDLAPEAARVLLGELYAALPTSPAPKADPGIAAYVHCAGCLKRAQILGKHLGAVERLNVGFTSAGLRVWCPLHGNVLHVDHRGLELEAI